MDLDIERASKRKTKSSKCPWQFFRSAQGVLCDIAKHLSHEDLDSLSQITGWPATEAQRATATRRRLLRQRIFNVGRFEDTHFPAMTHVKGICQTLRGNGVLIWGIRKSGAEAIALHRVVGSRLQPAGVEFTIDTKRYTRCHDCFANDNLVHLVLYDHDGLRGKGRSARFVKILFASDLSPVMEVCLRWGELSGRLISGDSWSYLSFDKR